MAGTRPIPKSYYYSGQGRVLLGDRDPVTGAGSNFRGIGNCTALSFEVTSEKFEHTESMSGLRATDLVIPKEKKATIKFTCESLSLDNLALGLFGSVGTVAGASVVDEVQKYVAGGSIPMGNGGITGIVTVKTGAAPGTATAVAPEKFTVDTDFGMIYPLDPTAFTGANVYLSYTHSGHKRLDVFTQALPPEKFLRFEGLNTTNDDIVLIAASRVAFDPLPATQLINEELGSAEFTGNVLLDPTITVGSKFFTQRIMNKPAA